MKKMIEAKARDIYIIILKTTIIGTNEMCKYVGQNHFEKIKNEKEKKKKTFIIMYRDIVLGSI